MKIEKLKNESWNNTYKTLKNLKLKKHMTSILDKN